LDSWRQEYKEVVERVRVGSCRHCSD